MVESELGQTFTWAGGSYACTIGDRTEGKTLEDGGFAPVADLVLVVRSAQFTTLPASQDAVTVGARQMRIATVDHSPCGSFLVLNLVDDNRGV